METIEVAKQMEWYKFSLLAAYLLSLIILVIAGSFNAQARSLIKDIHSARDGEHSWTRWASSLVLIVMLGIFIFQVTFDKNINETIFAACLAIVLGAKTTEAILKKT